MVKQSAKRNPFWDSLKVFLIFLVVYGHMIETCVDNSLFNQATYNFIYLFHMPLFVFVTGRFSHIKDRRKYISRMLTIFETYIVFQFIRCSKSLFYDGHLSLFPDILIPKGILWYLACLLLWRLIVLTARDYIERYKWFFLLLFFATGIGIGFILVPDGTVIRFYIFIVMALRPLLANDSIPNNEILLFIISLVICFGLAWLTQHLKIMTIMLNPISYIINKSKSDSK